MNLHSVSIVLALLLLADGGRAQAANTLPTGFVVDLLAQGLPAPNDLCFLPDGRCLVAHSAGLIKVQASGARADLGTIPSIQHGGEQGLLSIEADPGFAANGYVYVYYSSTADSFMHLDRFTCIGDRSNPASTGLLLDLSSRRVVLDSLPNNSPFHNGGAVRFGPDGKLYLGVGDDDNACAAQVTNSGVGCLLRLDVATLPAGGSLIAPSFAALDPGDNPLSANTDISQLVIAHGLRNPFRMEIDPITGDLFIADVGADLVEELDHFTYPTGAFSLVNFGWPWREGDINGPGCSGSAPANLTDPIFVAPRATLGWVAISTGPRYRNLGRSLDFGAAYEGAVFTYDFFTGHVRRLASGPGGVWQTAAPVPGQPSPETWANSQSFSALRQAPDGSLWFTRLYMWGGELGRIRPQAAITGAIPIGGDRQVAVAGESFAEEVEVRVFDATGTPAAGAPVTFTVSGPGHISNPGQISADWMGYARVSLDSGSVGGPVTVTASMPGGASTATFSLFARKLTASTQPSSLTLQVENQTQSVPPNVPFVFFLGLPGAPGTVSSIGPLCIDPAHAFAIVIEDGVGSYGGISFSGAGSIGTPGLTRIYPLPAGLLAGLTVKFQAIGLDPLGGWVRTNCERLTF